MWGAVADRSKAENMEMDVGWLEYNFRHIATMDYLGIFDNPKRSVEFDSLPSTRTFWTQITENYPLILIFGNYSAIRHTAALRA